MADFTKGPWTKWYIENDETDEGGILDEVNAFWIAGKRRAEAALAKAEGRV